MLQGPGLGRSSEARRPLGRRREDPALGALRAGRTSGGGRWRQRNGRFGPQRKQGLSAARSDLELEAGRSGWKLVPAPGGPPPCPVPSSPAPAATLLPRQPRDTPRRGGAGGCEG